jgi:hypothetical protein
MLELVLVVRDVVLIPSYRNGRFGCFNGLVWTQQVSIGDDRQSMHRRCAGSEVRKLYYRLVLKLTRVESCPSWAAIKVMTGEMTDRSNQDIAFSSLQIAYRCGQIIG